MDVQFPGCIVNTINYINLMKKVCVLAEAHTEYLTVCTYSHLDEITKNLQKTYKK